MSEKTTPFGAMPDMQQMEDMSRVYNAAVPGALNLMAHPIAGAAAAGAVGFGLAGQVAGVWFGTWAGMAEASQRLWNGGSVGGLDDAKQDIAAAPDLSRADPTRHPEAVGAAMRTADAGEATREMTRSAAKATDEVLADAVVAAAAAADEEKERAETAPRSPEPDRQDDLKAISGIGPKLEQVLKGMGISSYARIAALSEAEIARLDDELGFSGRIARDDWIGQARKLAGLADE